MGIKGLLQKWEQHGNRPRTARDYAVRLTVDDAARIHALAEMFPGRTEEEIITDLLSAALADLAESMPYEPGTRIIAEDDHGDPIYEDSGLTPRFMALTRRHRERLLEGLGSDGRSVHDQEGA